MREKINAQTEIDFQPSTLKLTNAYYAKYESVSSILDENPSIVDAQTPTAGGGVPSFTPGVQAGEKAECNMSVRLTDLARSGGFLHTLMAIMGFSTSNQSIPSCRPVAGPGRCSAVRDGLGRIRWP
jgi:hypothetical protein